MEDRMMTMTELATWLQIHPKTIQRWIKDGLPVLNIGSPVRPDWRFAWVEVRAWLEEREKRRRNPPVPG
jgi:predicted site-specific integrase-resolvase